MSAPKNLPPGASSLDLSQIKSVQQLAQLLAPYFLSSSLGTAPLAQGTSGNRNVVLTSKSDYVQSFNGQTGAVTSPPTDAAQVALVAGSYAWTFATKFTNPPLVFAFPVGAPPSAGTTLYAAANPTNTGVTINSTDATDVRTLELYAFGNPS
jgi:hypothetical protein